MYCQGVLPCIKDVINEETSDKISLVGGNLRCSTFYLLSSFDTFPQPLLCGDISEVAQTNVRCLEDISGRPCVRAYGSPTMCSIWYAGSRSTPMACDWFVIEG